MRKRQKLRSEEAWRKKGTEEGTAEPGERKEKNGKQEGESSEVSKEA